MTRSCEHIGSSCHYFCLICRIERLPSINYKYVLAWVKGYCLYTTNMYCCLWKVTVFILQICIVVGERLLSIYYQYVLLWVRGYCLYTTNMYCCGWEVAVYILQICIVVGERSLSIYCKYVLLWVKRLLSIYYKYVLLWVKGCCLYTTNMYCCGWGVTVYKHMYCCGWKVTVHKLQIYIVVGERLLSINYKYVLWVKGYCLYTTKYVLWVRGYCL